MVSVMAEPKPSSNDILRSWSLAPSKLSFPLQWLCLHVVPLSLGWPPEARDSILPDYSKMRTPLHSKSHQ